MTRMVRHLLLLPLFLALIAGCSSGPRYQVQAQYLPPTGAEGRQCLGSCENQRRTCEQHCQAAYGQCLDRAARSAQQAMPALLDAYALELQRYQVENDRYIARLRTHEHRLRHKEGDYHRYQAACDRGDKAACKTAERLADELRHLRYDEPDEPEAPARPSLAQETERLQQRCNADCGCQAGYDRCYGSCGGQVSYQRLCVENCQ